MKCFYVSMFFLVLFQFSSLNCSRSDYIYALIKTVHVSVEETSVVFLMTEYDCEVCVNSLRPWLDQIKRIQPNIPLFGIYFQKRMSETSIFSKTIMETGDRIKWTVSDDVELFSYLSSKYPNYKFPLALKFEKGEIRYIKEVNVDVFECFRAIHRVK